MAAIKSQNALLKVSTATITADNISAITGANPGVVSSASHGMAAGAIAVLASIGGMTQLNDRAFVVGSPASGTFELKGVDTSGYSAYTSGGTATEQTMTEVGQVNSIEGFNGQSTEIDTTHLRSTAKEFLIGLQDFGTVSLGLLLASGDAGQAKLRALKASAAIGTFSLTLSDGTIAAFRGFVQSFSFGGLTPDGAVTAQVQIRVSGEPAWFA
jgi:hypothetical protein